MHVGITKVAGYWRLLINGASIKTPYAECAARMLVVAYARRSFPNCEIFEA